MKKATVLLVIVCLLACIGAGCTAKGGSGGSGGLRGNITYWSHNNQSFVRATQEIIDKFVAANPGVKINYQNFPYDVTMNKMKTSYAAKDEADIIQGFGAWMYTYMANGLLAEVPANGFNAGDFLPSAIDGYAYKGKYYGLPREVNVENGVVYYPEFVREIPKTFSELVALGKSLTVFDGRNIARAGLDSFAGDGNMFYPFDWIVQQGGTYFKADGLHVNLTSPEAVRAFGIWVDINKPENGLTDIRRLTADEGIENLFFQRRSFMAIKGPWVAAMGVDYDVDDFAYDAMPPAFGDVPTFVCEPGWGEVISARSKVSEAAWAFALFSVNKENSMLFNKATGTIPARKDVVNDQSFINDPENAKIKKAFPMMANSIAIGPIVDSDLVKMVLDAQLRRAISGEVRLQDALKTAEDEINSSFDLIFAQING